MIKNTALLYFCNEVVSVNDKQQRFVLEYLTDFNATQAAIRAGYSETHIKRLLKNFFEKDGL